MMMNMNKKKQHSIQEQKVNREQVRGRGGRRKRFYTKIHIDRFLLSTAIKGICDGGIKGGEALICK